MNSQPPNSKRSTSETTTWPPDEDTHVDHAVYEQLSRLGKALANPGRIKILDLLEQGEHTVEDIAAAAGMPVKNTSAQLQQLRAAQLISGRRDGVRIYYRLAGPAVTEFMRTFEAFAEQTLADLQIELERIRALPGGMEGVSVEEFQDRLSAGATIIVDVRPPEDYARGHLPGAISMPLDELRSRIDELPSDADIVAYCEGPYCFASARAVRQFAEAGRGIHRIEGGLASWVRSGGRLDRPSADDPS